MPDRNPESLFAAAKTAYDARVFSRARNLCNQILEQDRKNVKAIMLLSEVARSTDRLTEELDCITRAVKLQPKSGDLRFYLGRAYQARGAYQKALVQFDKALKLKPELTRAVVAKASLYRNRNDYKKARALLEPLVRADPSSPGVVLDYLHVLVHDGEHERAIELGRPIVDAGVGPRPLVRETWFVLAQAHEKLGDYEAAFAAATAGNALSEDRFVPEEFRAIVDSCIETFTPSLIAALPRAEPSPLPVFVVGVPRCGSTLVEQIIASHPKASGVGESRAMVPIFSDMATRLGSAVPYPYCVKDLTPEHAASFSRMYLDEIRAGAPRAERVVDKALDNSHHLGLINLLFPAARVVHCRRDPVDTALSCYLSPFQPGQFPPASDLLHIASHYRQYERLMQHWWAVLDIPMLEVVYEQLVDDQERETRRIIEFCGLEWDERCLRFHETVRPNQTLSYDQVRQPLYRSSVGRAERFAALLDPVREALAEADATAS